jgi:glycosyltransferase involved in cell wall biosynthesis
MLHGAGRVVAVSEPLRDTVIRRWKLPPEQVVTVANGADTALFAAALPAGGYDNGQDAGPSGSEVIFVGSFKPWHGLDLLLEAFALLARRCPSARLVLVGDGPARPDLERRAARPDLAGRVTFTGVVPHPEVAPKVARAAVAVVNPRRTPATVSQSPLKLFEYMAAGKAIVAPDLPNLARILTDGQDARLVPPDRPDALAAALEELLGDEPLRRRLGEAARNKALQQHSWGSTVQRLENLFHDLL